MGIGQWQTAGIHRHAQFQSDEEDQDLPTPKAEGGTAPAIRTMEMQPSPPDKKRPRAGEKVSHALNWDGARPGKEMVSNDMRGNAMRENIQQSARSRTCPEPGKLWPWPSGRDTQVGANDAEPGPGRRGGQAPDNHIGPGRHTHGHESDSVRAIAGWNPR